MLNNIQPNLHNKETTSLNVQERPGRIAQLLTLPCVLSLVIFCTVREERMARGRVAVLCGMTGNLEKGETTCTHCRVGCAR